jgi:hypothetical protein
MTVGRIALFTGIVLMPTLVGALILSAPRWLAALGERLADRRANRQPADPEPANRPIEQLAADLRRLIRLHGELSVSAQLATRAQRLWSVEAAIAARAVETARALDVAHTDPCRRGGVDRAALRRLLEDLAAAGLVLPARVGPFTDDGRL